MRIIAGDKRGCTIDAPRGRDTRPTLDRVREAIFGMIQFDIADKTVLDLFAGSGAMGLEALSRYAAFAVFADNSREAAAIVGRNIDRLGYNGMARLYNCDYARAIADCAAAGRKFDIVFLDPPYEYGLIVPAINTMKEHGVLNPGHMIIAEYALDNMPCIPEGHRVRSEKRYGEIGVSIIVEDLKQ